MRAALIPMKDLAQAKMRLADVLDRRERAELALAMLTDVVNACREAACFDIVAVISGDSEIHWHVRDLGGRPLPEPGTLSGLNEGLTFGQRFLSRRLATDELAILPADIPLVRAEDVRAVVDGIGAAGERAALVRARDGGTNALVMRPAEAMPMRFGHNSADAHIAAAADAGIEIVELNVERIAFDVDSPEDLASLAARPAGAATAGWLEARAHYAGGKRA